MKFIFLFALVTFSFVSQKETNYTFFRIDENIRLEDIKFDKEVERWNRTIKVKDTKFIKFILNVNGKEHDFKLKKKSILNLNTISFKKNEKKENGIEINRGHTIVKYAGNDDLDFKVIVHCFSIVIDGNDIKTNSEVFDKDLKSNPSFFF